jgi:hypothetical protein
MRLLILSSEIHDIQKYKEYKFLIPGDIELTIESLFDSDAFKASLFDYDVSIIHIEYPRYNTIGYYNNLPKISEDFLIALKNGRSIICLPSTNNFISKKSNHDGMKSYDWLSQVGVELRDNIGSNIKPSGSVQAIAIKKYLESAPTYYQIIIKPVIPPNNRLAVIADTEIIIGMEYEIQGGTLVILPPPLLDEKNYSNSLSALINVSRRYFDRAKRRIFIGDAPEWLDHYLVPRAHSIIKEIEKLKQEKDNFDKASYVLYGTGQDLEDSVGFLLQQIGFIVEPQPKGSNIDQKVRYQALNINFAFEITGTKDIVKKDTNKIAQAWQHLTERIGTTGEADRLVIVANTQYHLDPKTRNPCGYSPDITNLLSKNGVALMTTYQLYQVWVAIQKGSITPEKFASKLHSCSGLFNDIN